MPLDILSRTTGLANTACADLAVRFAVQGHSPSPEQWLGIQDALDHIERGADGTLDTKLYVSALPAGLGKSQLIAAAARALMSNATRNGVGMLILVNRIAEALDMARALDGYGARLCIITSDPEVNQLGAHEKANDAQVCIATQASFKATMKGLPRNAPFADADRFHYHGRRRAIVCWDEAFAFNRPVTLDADAVVWLTRVMRRQSDEAATTLKRWASDLDGHPGGLCSVPDFEHLGVDFRRLEDDIGDQSELVAQVKALAVVSGDEGFVTRQGAASIMVTHYPEIPRSLMPLVVLDASARANPSYAQMARTAPLEWLRDAPKTYSNMTLRIVSTAASRSVYRDQKTTRGRDLIDLAVRYIESVPGEAVLVIGYKGRFGIRGVAQPTIKDAITARLKPEDIPRFHYLPYGQHTATNGYKHCKRVLLMGLNFVPKAVGHATSGAALDLDLIDHHPTNEQIKAMQIGLLMDSTLQALQRGSARVAVGGDCGQMEAVIIQTKQTGLSLDSYRRAFPGVQIRQDTVLLPPTPLKGRLKDLAAIITRRLEAGEREMTNASLYGEMGMAKGDFRALVKKPDWQAYVAQLGLNPQKLSGRNMGLRLVRQHREGGETFLSYKRDIPPSASPRKGSQLVLTNYGPPPA